jgi:hypothetical protein
MHSAAISLHHPKNPKDRELFSLGPAALKAEHQSPPSTYLDFSTQVDFSLPGHFMPDKLFRWPFVKPSD